MLRPEDERIGRLRAAMSSYRRREDRALAVIAGALRDHGPLYVSFSAGKDSTVLLDLARQVAPGIEARIRTSEESEVVHPDLAGLLDFWRARGVRVTEVCLRRGPITERRGGGWGALRDVAPSNGHLIGLRQQEGVRRRIALRRYGEVHVHPDGRVRVAPLSRWLTEDIAARIVSRGLPVLREYGAEGGLARRTAAGIPTRKAREMLSDLRARDPAAWTRLREMMPDISDLV